MKNEWISVEDGYPQNNERVLTYSPVYKDVNNEMLFRMMSGDVVKFCSDVKYWTIPEPPSE